MDSFTARGALLAGLDLIRRRPLLIALWAALLLAQTVVFTAALQQVMAMAQGGIFAGRSAGSFGGRIWVFSLAQVGVSLVMASVLWSSAFRAILRPAVRGPLGFGGEELFVLGAWLIPQLAVVIVSTPLLLALFGQFRVPDGRWIRPTASVFGVLGVFWSEVAAVWAFDRRQVAPFRCWTIARGRFWPLAALVVGVAILQHLADAGGHRLSLALAAGHDPSLGATTPSNPFVPPSAALTAVFQPSALLQDAMSAAVGALKIAFVAAIVASALRASPLEPQAASFSTGATAPPS